MGSRFAAILFFSLLLTRADGKPKNSGQLTMHEGMSAGTPVELSVLFREYEESIGSDLGREPVCFTEAGGCLISDS